MLNAPRILAGLLIVALLAVASPARATLVTFDFEEFSVGQYNSALVSNGFVLDPGGVDWYPGYPGYPDSPQWIGHYHIADQTSWHSGADNGTKFFVFDYYFDDSILNIYSTTGAVFGIQKFDLTEAGYNIGGNSVCDSSRNVVGFEWVCAVTFTGYLADGGTISRRVFLDGIYDGAGPLADFETFTFGGQWNRLTMFSIVPSHGYLNPGLDNLVLRAAPEPSTLALFGLGLAGLVLTRRRNKITND